MCHKHSSRIGVFSYWVQENILIYIEEKKQNRYMQCMGIEDFLHINLVQNLHRVSLEGLINPPHLSLQYPAFPLETMSNISNSKRSISIQGDPSNTEFLLFHVLRCFNVKALHYFWKHFMQMLFTFRLHWILSDSIWILPVVQIQRPDFWQKRGGVRIFNLDECAAVK